MNNKIEDNIGHQQVGEDLHKLRSDEQRAIQDKQAIRFAFNEAFFKTYSKRFADMTHDGVREQVMIDYEKDIYRHIDLTDFTDIGLMIERKISKHELTGQMLFDDVVVSVGNKQPEIFSTQTIRFAVEHVNERSVHTEQIFNLICPEFYKIPGVQSPRGSKPDWISMVMVNETQLESIKSLL